MKKVFFSPIQIWFERDDFNYTKKNFKRLSLTVIIELYKKKFK